MAEEKAERLISLMEQIGTRLDSNEMIDDFRLRGSRTWRRMGGHLTKGGWRT